MTDAFKGPKFACDRVLIQRMDGEDLHCAFHMAPPYGGYIASAWPTETDAARHLELLASLDDVIVIGPDAFDAIEDVARTAFLMGCVHACIITREPVESDPLPEDIEIRVDDMVRKLHDKWPDAGDCLRQAARTAYAAAWIDWTRRLGPDGGPMLPVEGVEIEEVGYTDPDVSIN